jgi:hypothetical protein
MGTLFRDIKVTDLLECHQVYETYQNDQANNNAAIPIDSCVLYHYGCAGRDEVKNTGDTICKHCRNRSPINLENAVAQFYTQTGELEPNDTVNYRKALDAVADHYKMLKIVRHYQRLSRATSLLCLTKDVEFHAPWLNNYCRPSSTPCTSVAKLGELCSHCYDYMAFKHPDIIQAEFEGGSTVWGWPCLIEKKECTDLITSNEGEGEWSKSVNNLRNGNHARSKYAPTVCSNCHYQLSDFATFKAYFTTFKCQIDGCSHDRCGHNTIVCKR